MAAANYTNDVLKMFYGEMSDPGGDWYAKDDTVSAAGAIFC